MKKVLIVLLLLLVPLLSSCDKENIKVYDDQDIASFNKLLNNIGNGKTKAYDLRKYEECYEGRIPGFYCSRVHKIENEQEALDKVVSDLSTILGNKYKTLIILIDGGNGNSNYVASKLEEKGFTNIRYFKNGYNKYVELVDDFIPDVGDCDC